MSSPKSPAIPESIDDTSLPDSKMLKEASDQFGSNTDVAESSSSGGPVDTDKNEDIENNAMTRVVTKKLDWDGPDDPENPLNWPAYKRSMQVVCVALFTLLANLAATMFAPGVERFAEEFDVTSSIVISMTVSIYVVGFALGPLVLAPLSEVYGRLPVYAGSGIVYIAFLFGCAFATNVSMFIVFRLISGGASAASMAISGGTLADVIPREQRGRWMGLFVLGPLLGPVIGPIAGGFIAQNLGWRWVFRVLLIACGVVGLLCVVFIRETYGPTILRHRAARRAKAQGSDGSVEITQVSATSQLARSITRPLRLLLFSPIVLFLSLYASFAFGLMFLLFTTFSTVFVSQYGWSIGLSGLSYLGLGIGMFVGVAAQAQFSDRYMKSRAAKRGGESKPEDRLMVMAYVAPVLPVGMFWYGWAADQQTHWIVPILGSVFIGLGIVFVLMPQLSYLVDVYGSEAGASALSANMTIRCIAGAFLPLAGPPMYESLGLGWGNSLLAFLAVAFIPVPWILAIYGERIRLSRTVRL